MLISQTDIRNNDLSSCVLEAVSGNKGQFTAMQSCYTNSKCTCVVKHGYTTHYIYTISALYTFIVYESKCGVQHTYTPHTTPQNSTTQCQWGKYT